MLSRFRRLTQRLCALAFLLAFSLSMAESLSCAEEQGVELVSQHEAELKAGDQGSKAPADAHCCACIHTFVSTVRVAVVDAQEVAYTTRFIFQSSAPLNHLTEPLVPPPIA